MKKRLALLACIALAGFGLAQQAFAQNTQPSAQYANVQAVKTATQWCYGLVSPTNGNGDAQHIISSLVQCFTDTSQGIIPSVAWQFISNAQQWYLPVVSLMCLLAIAWYGVRIMTGDVQRLKADTFTLGLKLAGIFFFIDYAPTIYLDMVSILQYLSYTISNSATTVYGGGFCTNSNNVSSYSPTSNSSWQPGLWAQWDCIFQYLLGFSATGFAAASIASFLLLMLFSATAGIAIFFMALGLIIGLLVGAFRFIHVYLMSVLALSFLFCFGYLLVPLLLFRNTFQYFQTWLTLVFGYILTPVIMFGFMGLMLLTLDVAIFSGSYSVFCVIGGSNYCGTNASNDGNLFSNMTATVDDTPGGKNPNLQTGFWEAFWVALNNPDSFTQKCQTGNSGGVGYQCAPTASTGSTPSNAVNSLMARSGLTITTLNLSKVASNAGSSCTASTTDASGNTVPANCPWLGNVLTSVSVAALLLYIMVSLLSYIPTLASNLTADLISQDFASAKGRELKETVFGESTAKQMAQGTEGAATAAADGKGVSGSIAGFVDSFFKRPGAGS